MINSSTSLLQRFSLAFAVSLLCVPVARAADFGPSSPSATLSTEAALVQHSSSAYRRLQRSESRLDEGDDLDAVHPGGTALDLPHTAAARATIARAERARATTSDSVVLPHQTYALMSAGLLSMALVVVRRRRH